MAVVRAKMVLPWVVALAGVAFGKRVNLHVPSEVDDFLASLEMDSGDPVNTVHHAGLDRPGDTRAHPIVQEVHALETIEEVRDREDQMHVTEAHRMKCAEVLRTSGEVGQVSQGMFRSSEFMTAEDQTIYQNPNDDPIRGNGGSSGVSANGHPQHGHHCHAVKDHSMRKVALAGELDLPPFFEKLGEFEIAGLDHGKLAENELFVKAIWADRKVQRIAGLPSQRGYGLDTVKPDGRPTVDSMMPLQEWVITSRTWDTEVKPKLEAVAKEVVVAKKFGAAKSPQTLAEGLDCSNAFDSWKEVNFKVELGCLLKAVETQEKFIPFNHKLEKVDIDFYKCSRQGNAAACQRQGTRYLHDEMLTYDSADTTMMKDLQVSDSPRSPGGNMFHGISFGDMITEGTIAWSVTVSAKGKCAPAMLPLLYVGIGSDSDVDLDLGTVLYSWDATLGGSTMTRKQALSYSSTSQKAGQITEAFTVRKCVSGSRSACGPDGDALVEYSGDKLEGAGEGDDEWMAFDLEKLLRAHVTHIAIVVNIFSGGTFDSLEGSFFRAVMSDRGEKAWATAQTVEYVDLDTMKVAHGKRAAIVATLFVDSMANLLLPSESKVLSENHASSTSPEVAEIKQELTALAKVGLGRLSASQKNKFNQLKKDLFRVAKTKYETVVAKHPMECGSRCSLSNVYGQIADYFTQHVGSQPDPSARKTANALDKATDAEAVTRHDVQSQNTVSEVDDFLASLEQDVPANTDLQVSGGSASSNRLSAQVDTMAVNMGREEFDKGLLIEFPGGPPGADLLCLKS